GGPAHGTLTFDGATGAFTYAPATNYNGADAFSFTANDGQSSSAPATVSFDVTPVNDAPVATSAPLAASEDTAKAGQLAATDSDSTGLTFSIANAPSNGTLTSFDPQTGAFTYLANANFNG